MAHKCPKCASQMHQDHDNQSWLCNRAPCCDGRVYEQFDEEADRKKLFERYGVKNKVVQITFQCGHTEITRIVFDTSIPRKRCSVCRKQVAKQREKNWRSKNGRRKGNKKEVITT
jgi:hypothetical protein